MPVVVSYNFSKFSDDANIRNRIKSMFCRFGWEHVGNTCFRYPSFANQSRPEDWLNHVAPALMLFRTYIIDKSLGLEKFTIDVQTSTFVDPVQNPPVGAVPVNGPNLPLQQVQPNDNHFGESELRTWVGNINLPAGY